MRRIGWVVVGLGLAVMPAAAQEAAPAFTLAKEFSDPQHGFTLRLPARAHALPVRRMPEARDRRLYWYEGQCLRSWVVQTPGRNAQQRLRILVGAVQFPPTNAWMSGQDAAAPAPEWPAPMRKAWVQFFSELPVTAVDGNHYTLRSATHAGHAWIRERSGRSYCLLYKYPLAWEPAVAPLAAESAEGMGECPVAEAAVLEPLQLQGLPAVPKEDPLAAPRRATRERVQRDLAGVEGWWYVMTPHYCLVSNIDTKVPANADAVRAMANGLEQVRTGYLLLFPPKQAISAVSVVKVFAHRDQLYAHFSERAPMKLHGGIQGMWVNVYDELVQFHDPAASKLPNTLTTVYHEGFHQYVHYALGAMPIPRWFDEGTGDFFGGAVVDATGLRIAENRTRKHNVTKIVNGTFTEQYNWTPPTLERLVSMTRQEFYAEVKWQVFRYSMCWGLIYYLRKGIDADSPYAGILDRYIDTLHATKSPDAARQAAFGPVDMAQLEKDWRAFWLDPERRKAAEARRLVSSARKK